MFWFQQGLCYLPVFLVIWASATFIISYIIAVCRYDVEVLIPFISDTGNTPPESCVFGIMTFISACAGIGTIFAMYKYVERLSEDTGVVNPYCNKAALGLGIISCFGMCIVATFQESAVQIVHLIGAFLFFLSGTSYLVLQTIISFRSYPYGASRYVCCTRLIITVISIVAFFPTVICKNFEQDPHLQMTSAACEWVVAFSFVCYFFTYIDDFKHFTLQVKTVCD